MPFFICPNCKHRSVDDDGREGLTDNAVACSNCGFGFLFELMDDYYPGPNTGFVVCDQEGRVLAVGRGVFELTGYGDRELMGRDLVEGLHMNGFEPQQNPAKLALEWGVRRLDQRIGIKHDPVNPSGSSRTSSPPTTATGVCSWRSRQTDVERDAGPPAS